VEWEKAKVAQQKGIKPGSDFEVGNYESQWKDRNSDWESAKKDVESLDKKTKDREQSWKEAQAQQAKLKG
jgi:hypothetical protein